MEKTSRARKKLRLRSWGPSLSREKGSGYEPQVWSASRLQQRVLSLEELPSAFLSDSSRFSRSHVPEGRRSGAGRQRAWPGRDSLLASEGELWAQSHQPGLGPKPGPRPQPSAGTEERAPPDGPARPARWREPGGCESHPPHQRWVRGLGKNPPESPGKRSGAVTSQSGQPQISVQQNASGFGIL